MALRIDLAGARSLGLAFDVAWPGAVVRAAGMSDKPEEWLPVLAGCRAAWAAAYERLEASPTERALVSIAEPPAGDYELERRRCGWCDLPVPTDRDPRARFCGDRCKRDANYELERVRAGHPPRERDAHGLRALRTPSIVAQLCECCAVNWVLAPGRFCSSWCEERAGIAAARG